MKTFIKFTTRALIFAAALIGMNARAALTDISNSPLVTSSSTSVKPNIMYVLDNSGSMAWDYMPDNDNSPYFPIGSYGYPSAQCNGVYYDPTQTYALPVNSAGTTYPASSFTAAPIDGFGTSTTSTINLNANFALGQYTDTSPTTSGGGMAYYYNYTGSQTTLAQKTILNSSSTFFKECNSNIGSSPGNAVFTKVRLSTTETTTITVGSGTATTVSSITVNGVQLMGGTSTGGSTNTSTIAGNISAKIYLNGFSATSSGNVVTITGPTSAANYIPVITQSGSMTLTTDVFPDTNSAHLQNFANWYSYYRTRILMMKTAAGLVFQDIDNRYRVGFTTISNTGVNTDTTCSMTSSNSTFLMISDFDSVQKSCWYTKFYAVVPSGSTPLRIALAKAGRIYAGQLLTGANDPVQYSCQQNFTILSTDGYWNDSTKPTQINGTTAVGEQDALEARPMYDGAGVTYGRSTSQIQESQSRITQTTTQVQKRTTQIQSSTSSLQQQTSQLRQDIGTLQSQTTQLQKQTSTLQSQTSQLQKFTSSLQSSTATLQSSTSTLQGTLSKVLMQCNNTAAACGTAPVTGIANSNWSVVTSGSCTTSTSTQCAIVSNIGTTSAVVTLCNTAAAITTVSNPAITPSHTTSAYISDNSHKMALGLSSTNPDSTSGHCVLLGGTGANTAWFCRGSSGSNPVVSSSSVTDSTGKTWYLVSSMSGNTGCTTDNAAWGSGYSTSYGACPSTPASTTYTLNNADSNGKIYSSCSYSSWSTPANAASCTYQNQSATPNNTSALTATMCSYTTWTSPSTVSSCTAQSETTATTNGTVYNTAPKACSYTAWSSPTGVSTCTNTAQSSGPTSYTVGTATQCNTVVTSPFANTASCTVTTTPNTSGNTTQCQYSAWGSWSGASSCTAVAQSTGPTNYTVATATNCQTVVTAPYANAGSCTVTTTPNASGNTTQCQYAWVTAQPTPSCSTPTYVAGNYSNPTVYNNCNTVVTSPFANASSCAATTTPNGSGNTTQCQYSAWSAWANASSCTPVAQSVAPSYTVGTATQCQTTDTGWVGVSSCTPNSSGGQTVTCQGPVVTTAYVASCTSQTANSGNNWTTIGCSTQTIMAPTPVASCTAAAPSAGNNYVTTTCTTVTTGPTSASSCTPAAASASNNWTTTTCGTPVISGGTYNTLADVAEYYWATDLRTPALGNCTGSLGIDVCQNNVPGTAPDINPQQHMTTFTLGLASGTLGWTPDYLSGGSADYNSIVAGTLNWPDPTVAQNATRIDDLWHAAVDGRGVFYSARNAASLVTGLSNALAGVTAREGSSSSAATSSLEPVAGDNFLYIASYRTVFWDGDLQARTIDPTTGNISSTLTWSAQALLDANVSASSDTRTIYTYDSSAANKLIPFLWGSMSSSEQANFNNICSPTALLSQCPTLTAAQQTAASGQNLVNYLRGQHANEGTLYRTRAHVLGDMVDSQPQYVKVPPFSYVDGGYSSFQSAQANRNPEVYVAANDGMLHAFDGATGQESWAYIPPFVMSNLYNLADDTYDVNHRFYVDGSPVAGDICPNAPASGCSGTQWKTILVGGQNAGGRGYYALDITNPSAPAALWNFTSANDSDLGYSFGNPIIAKRKDGTWVVVVASGYNNVSPGSGQGFVFVLNAYTGQLLEKIGTGVGSTGSPSGLAKINAWINVDTDKTAARFYGGDLLGELWRITLDPNAPANSLSTAGTAFMLAQAGQTNGAGNQPITTVPQVTTVTYAGSNYNVIEFGTGEYLGLTDLTDTSQQSVYAIKDILGTTSLGLVRASPPSVLVQQVMTDTTSTNGTDVRTITNNPVDWATKDGWYVDLNPGNTSPGERVNIDPQLNQGLLTVATNVPTSNACDASGYAFLYYFDFQTGSASSTAIDNQVGQRDTENSMVAGMNYVYLQTPTGVEGVNIVCTTDATCHTTIPPPPPPPTGGVYRFSWRELVQ